MKKEPTKIQGRKSIAPYFGSKSRAALAVAVSLMCSCGVASANSGGEIERHHGDYYIGNKGLTDNNVYVDDATGLEGAYGAGGNGDGQDVSGNTITVDSVSNTKLSVVGANTSFTSNADPGNAVDNHVVVRNSTVQDIGGGQAGDGNASKNTITIENNSVVKSNVWGGSSGWHGTAAENVVTITDSTVERNVFGGWSSNGDSEGITNKNHVIIKGSTVKENVYGGQASNTNENNSITLNDAVVGGSVYGGNNDYSFVLTTGKDVAGNKLYLSGNNNVNGNVFNVETVYLENAVWDTEKPMLAVKGEHRTSSEGYALDDGVFHDDRELFFNGLANGHGSTITTSIDASNLSFVAPKDVKTGAMMDLIQSVREIRATLVTDTISQAYDIATAAGVTINAALEGSLAFNTDKTVLTYTAEENKATKLTFGNVAWSENALIDHSKIFTNVDFNGADVDTAKINFTNIQNVDANQKMTLISDFGSSVGTITGTTFTIGQVSGEGHPYLEGGNLRYVVTKGVSEQSGSSDDGNNGGTVPGGENPANYNGFMYDDYMGYYAGNNGPSNNNVLLDDSVDLEVADCVYGGAGPDGGASVSHNTITVTSTSMKENPGLFVAGGRTDPNSNAGEGDAIDNHAIIKGKVSNATGGFAGNGEVKYNSVIVESTGVVISDIMGGAVGMGDNVSENSAILNGGVVGENVYGGWAANGGNSANKNTVVINKGTVGENVYGGRSDNYSLNNRVSLTDAKIGGSVYGGYSDDSFWKGDGNDIQGNELHLSGVNTVVGNVFNVEKVYLENANWDTKKPLLEVQGKNVMSKWEHPVDSGVYNTATETFYNGSSPIIAAIDASNLTFANPDEVGRGETMNLIQSSKNLKAALLSDNTSQSYSVTPVTGATINAALEGSLAFNTDKTVLTYIAAENKATKLIFENVEWSDNALIDHSQVLKNVDFNGADIDTKEIRFTNIQSIEANQKMSLVSDFGTSVGTITGTTFMVGSSTGEGHAYLENNDLQYVVTKGVANQSDNPAEQTDDAINQGGSPISGNVTGDVTGGVAKNNGIAEKNTKDVQADAYVNGNVTAAISENGVAVENIAMVNQASVTGSVMGANSQSGVVTGNKATVTDSAVTGDVVAGSSQSGTVSNGNIASVTGSSVGGSVYGGKSGKGEVNTSVANIKNATIAGNVYGGMSEEGKANGNTVTLEDADITGVVYGGKSAQASDNNKVIVNGGIITKVVGGGCETASGNIVTIEGDALINEIFGAETGTSATNNQVFLGGNAKINGTVYGGYSESANGTTTGNSITLYDNVDVSAANLYGGSNSYSVTDNNLYIGRILEDGTKSPWTGGNQSVGSVQNFDAIHFIVVPWSKEKAALTVNSGDLTNTVISAESVVFTTDASVIGPGDTMTLLDDKKLAEAKRVQEANITKDSTYAVGTTTRGKGKLSLDRDGNVLYTVDTVTNEASHSSLIGAQAGMAALSIGNDFIDAAADGLGLAVNTGADGIATFAQVGGGELRQETGSHVNVNTWNSIIALGHKNAKEKSTMEYGAFFEYGRGNYTTHNGANRGDGSMHYTGGGILAKWQQLSGLYLEGSLRAGSVRDDARNVLRDAWGNPSSYSTSTGYWGTHIGVGKILKLRNGNELDIYGKYFMNRKNGVSFDTGVDHYDLDAVTSSVIRLGTYYTMKRDKWKLSGGLAYEYELDGEATGQANSQSIRAVDVGGGSVRAEIHATMTPKQDSPWSFDVNLTSFAGKKHGTMGGVSLMFRF